MRLRDVSYSAALFSLLYVKNLKCEDCLNLLDKLAEVFTDWLTTGPITHAVTEEGVFGSVITFNSADREREREGPVKIKETTAGKQQNSNKTDIRVFCFLFR